MTEMDIHFSEPHGMIVDTSGIPVCDKIYNYADAVRSLQQIAYTTCPYVISLKELMYELLPTARRSGLEYVLERGYIPVMSCRNLQAWPKEYIRDWDGCLITLDFNRRPVHWLRSGGSSAVTDDIDQHRAYWMASSFHWYPWSTVSPPWAIGNWWRSYGFKYNG